MTARCLNSLPVAAFRPLNVIFAHQNFKNVQQADQSKGAAGHGAAGTGSNGNGLGAQFS